MGGRILIIRNVFEDFVFESTDYNKWFECYSSYHPTTYYSNGKQCDLNVACIIGSEPSELPKYRNVRSM